MVLEKMQNRLQGSVEIEPWDWRHRIGFDLALKGEIIQASGSASSEERRIICELVEYFSNFISLDCLMNAIIEGRSDLLDQISNLPRNKILSFPDVCRGEVDNKLLLIEAKCKGDITELRSLVDQACGTDYVCDPREVMSIVFGNELDELIQYGQQEAATSAPQDLAMTDKKVDNPLQIVEMFIDEIQNYAYSQRIDIEDLPKFKTTLASGSGFAEYWPWYLTREDQENELILYLNSDSTRPDQLFPTLSHELYPGHAYFYGILEKARPRFIDHGAFALVEGWATWAEWNGVRKAYSDASRMFRLRSLPFLDCRSISCSNKIFTHIMNEGYSEANAAAACLQFYQYPSLGISYTLGAIWFERYCRSGSIDEFLRCMVKHERGWGDFFRLW